MIYLAYYNLHILISYNDFLLPSTNQIVLILITFILLGVSPCYNDGPYESLAGNLGQDGDGHGQ